jgi:hypothetical protein
MQFRDADFSIPSHLNRESRVFFLSEGNMTIVIIDVESISPFAVTTFSGQF